MRDVGRQLCFGFALLFACLGFGLWLCGESTLLMPWSHSASGKAGWEWVWFLPTQSVWISVLLSGVGFVGLGWLVSRGVRCLLLRFAGDLEMPVFSPVVVFLPGVLLFFAACVLYGVSLFSVDDRTGVLLWAAFLLSGRMAVVAVLWQGFVCDELVQLLSPFVRRYGLWIVCVFAVGVSVLLFTQHYGKLLGDEKSYVYTMISLFEGGGQIPSLGRVGELDRFFGDGSHFHIEVDTTSGVDTPKHFVGPALFLAPLYCIYKFGFGAASVYCVRGYMLCWFALWIVGSYVLARRLTGRPGASLCAAVLCGVSVPMLGLAGCIYPDNLAGYALLSAFLCVGQVWTQVGVRLRLWQCVAILVCAFYLPLLHLKYGLCSVVLGFFVLWFRPVPLRVRDVAVFVGVFLILLGAFARYYYVTYGFFLPGAPTAGLELTGRFGIFFDTDSGGFLYAPWWLLLPFGVWFLRCLSGRWAYSVVWCAVFLVIYQITCSVQFWGSSGSPVLRYMAPALGVCVPVLAAVFVVFERRWLPVVLLASVSCVLFFSYLSDPYYVYESHTQNGRMLWDNTFRMFSMQDFFPYFNYSWREVHTPHPMAHKLMMLGAFGLFALGAGLWRIRKFSPVSLVLLMQLPFSLAVSAAVAQSPVWSTTALRLFSHQTMRLSNMESWRKSQVRTAVRQPFTLRPMEVAGRRVLSPGNGLIFDRNTQDRGFAQLTALPRLAQGRYRVALHGRPTGSREGTGTLSMLVTQQQEEEVLMRVMGPAIPRRTPENSGTVGATMLAEGTFYLPKETVGIDDLKMSFHSHNTPLVWVDCLSIEYLGGVKSEE